MARISHQDSAVRFVTAKRGPERATKTRQYDLLRPTETATETRQYDLLLPNVGQKEPPRLGSTICCGQELSRKSYQDSAVRFVTAKSWPEKATKTRQYDLLRPNVCQKEPPRFGSTICYGQDLARISHQDSAVRFVTAKRGPERATKTRQYDLLWPNVGQKEPPRLGSTICHGQELARKSHGDSAVRFVTAKSWPERATKTRQYDLLRPNVGQKEPPRLGSTICYGQELARKSHRTICYGQTWARKSHQDSAVRFVAAKRGPERATKTRQYDLLRPRVGRKSHRDSAVLFVTAKSLARKSHQDTAVRFVAAKRVPEKATKTRQYGLLRPRVGQKEPPRLGSTICCGQELDKKNHQDSAVRFYGQTWARKSHQDSAVRFVTAKRWPERATKTRQYDLLRPRVGQKKPPRLGSTICYGQELFVTAKRGPERATKTRQYDLLRPRVVQKEPPRLGSTICYGQELARRSHQDSAVRCVTAKTWPQRATKTRQSDLLRPNVGHRDSAVRFVTAKTWPERATKTRQYDLLRPRLGQKEPPRLGSTICYGQELARRSHQDSAVRFVTAKRGPERATKTRQYDLLRPRLGQKKPPRLGKSHQDSAVRFVTAKCGPERATKTRQYELLRPRVGQKEPPRLGSTICYGQELARKSHQDSAVRFVTAKRGPERATKTRQYDLLRPRVGQKEPPRLGSTICYGQDLARKSHQYSAVRFVTDKSWPERATKTRQYDLLRPRVGQKKPPRLGSTICYGQTWARKRHEDSAVRFVTAKSCPERVTKTRQYDLLRPSVGQKKPPRLGSTICYGQDLARKSHRDSAVRFVTAKRGPERATKTRQYDLLRPNVGQKEPPRLGSTICYGQEFGQKEPPRLGSTICYGQTCARRSHQDSAIRFVTAKNWPERATKTRQYDLLRPRVGQKEPPRLGSTICYGQTWARKSHQDSAVRFVTAKRGPERATKTRQYDLLRPNVGQKEPPRLGSTICYGQDLARKSHQDSAVRFVTAKSWPEGATKTRQYDLLRPRVGQKEPPRLGSTICYGQELARKSHQDSAVRFVTANRKSHRDLAVRCVKSHQASAVRTVTAKSWPEKATKTRQHDLLRPNVGQKEPPRLGSTICYGQQKEPPRLGSTIWYGQEVARKSHQDSAVRFVTAKSWPEKATKTRKYDL